MLAVASRVAGLIAGLTWRIGLFFAEIFAEHNFGLFGCWPQDDGTIKVAAFQESHADIIGKALAGKMVGEIEYELTRFGNRGARVFLAIGCAGVPQNLNASDLVKLIVKQNRLPGHTTNGVIYEHEFEGRTRRRLLFV